MSPNTHSALPYWGRGRRGLSPLCDLVSRGTDTSELNQCHGSYSTNTKIGRGPGFQYACIHSGVVEIASSVATNWYNYVLASAGTIYDENTTSSNPAINANPATESICPKGWTLPSVARASTIGPTTGNPTPEYVSIFSPILGGVYYDSTLNNESTRGAWWTSEVSSTAPALRYRLNYDGVGLRSYGGLTRIDGMYIRCINKQKTVLDLTYMQEMTPEIASPAPPLYV